MPNKQSDYFKDLLGQIHIKSVMSTGLIKICEDEDLSKAEELFLTRGVYYLPVVDMANKLVGLLSQKYLYKTQAPRKMGKDELIYNPDILIDGNAFYHKESLDQHILRAVMLRDPFSLTPDDSILRAVLEMAKRKIGCICIVDKERKIQGLLTESHLIHLTAKILTE